MSGETSLKFLIPESSCQQDFAVSRLFADGAKEKILRCDWLWKYRCLSASGYFHTIENGHAVITVPRDLNDEPEKFICELFGQPKIDPSRCLCRKAGSNIDISSTSTIESGALVKEGAAITGGESDSFSPGTVGLIVGVSLGLGFVLVLILGFIIHKRCCPEPPPPKPPKPQTPPPTPPTTTPPPTPPPTTPPPKPPKPQTPPPTPPPPTTPPQPTPPAPPKPPQNEPNPSGTSVLGDQDNEPTKHKENETDSQEPSTPTSTASSKQNENATSTVTIISETKPEAGKPTVPVLKGSATDSQISSMPASTASSKQNEKSTQASPQTVPPITETISQADNPTLHVPQGPATDSQKTSTPPSTASSTRNKNTAQASTRTVPPMRRKYISEMTGEMSLKFLIPDSSCQQDFGVLRLFGDGAKEKILLCDWLEKYQCNSAPGYNHTIKNNHALITVPRDLNIESEKFICERFGQPNTDPSMCLCEKLRSNIDISSTSTIESGRIQKEGIIREGSNNFCGLEAGVIVGSIVAAVVVVVMVVVVAVIIYICRRPKPKEPYPKPWRHPFLFPWIDHNDYKVNQPSRKHNDNKVTQPSSKDKVELGAYQPLGYPKPWRHPFLFSWIDHNDYKVNQPSRKHNDNKVTQPTSKDNVELGAYQPLMPQADEPTMYVPQGSATDSQKSSKPPSTAPSTRNEKITQVSTRTVPLKKEIIIQPQHPALDNTSRMTVVEL